LGLFVSGIVQAVQLVRKPHAVIFSFKRLLFRLLSSPNQCHGVAAEVGAVAGVEAVQRFVLRSAKICRRKTISDGF
jgi:hypothetical protein